MTQSPLIEPTMATKPFHQRMNLTIHGYIRQQSINYIPIDIIQLSILFLKSMSFYEEEHGDGIEFIEDTRTVILKNARFFQTNINKTCLFGDWISAEYCDKYKINLKWNESGMQHNYFGVDHRFMMGFIFGETIQDSIKNFNSRLGMKENRKYSKGIFCGSEYHTFFVYENNYHLTCYNEDWNHIIQSNPIEGDIFSIEFDFIDDEYNVYRNDILQHSLDLQGHRKVMVGITLFYPGHSVTVKDWMFEMDDETWW